MIYPDVDLVKWCERTGLDLAPLECECGGENIPDRPYMTTRFYGVVVSECLHCGVEEAGQTFVFRNKDEAKHISELILGSV